jgi:hypothetical protein
MALNLNTSPYFDDFDSDKNYSQILFKPGVAVQARELTQLQTMLQNQVAGLGNYVLKSGAIISGCLETSSSISYIKINDVDFDGASINNSSLLGYAGEMVQGSVSGFKATIIGAVSGSVADAPAMKALYLKYHDYNGAAPGHFAAGEKLTVISPGGYKGNTFVANSAVGSTLGTRYYGHTTQITLSPGIVYVSGKFIVTTELSTYTHPFNNSLKRKVGFKVIEELITSTEDSTLKDPASGSFNANAPGADRLKTTVTLITVPFSTVSTPDFYEYATFENGAVGHHRIQTDPLSQVGDYVSKRLYETNGNFVKSGLNVSLREHLNDGFNGGVYASAKGGLPTKLVASMSPGTAFIDGRYVQIESPTVKVFDKPTSTLISEDKIVTTSYGNFIYVNEVSGVFDVDGGGQVIFYNAAETSVTLGTFSATTLNGDRIGTAKVRHFVLDSGTAGTAAAVYRLYLYDIKMEAADFSAIRTISYAHADAPARADAVLVSSKAVLQEGNSNNLIWKLPKTYIKTLKTNSGAYKYDFQYQKEFDVSLAGTGEVTITLSGNETFPYSAGALSDTLVDANIQMVARDAFTIDGTTIAAGKFIDLSGKVTVDSSTAITIDTGTTLTGTKDVRIYVNVKIANTSAMSKSLVENEYVSINAGLTPYTTSSTEFSLGVSDVLKVVEIRAHSASWATVASGDIATTGTDVTKQFRLDNGQKDNSYSHGKIIKNAIATINFSSTPYLLVKFNYFTKTVAGPTFTCFDSYPVNDAGGVGTIKTQEVPLYISPKSGVFNLRDCIDFRPYVTNTATTVAAASISSVQINPSTVQTIDRPANGLTNPVPIKNFTTDLEAYLTAGYRAVLNSRGEFNIIEGIQSESIVINKPSNGDMTLSTFVLKPYPSLAPMSAKYYNRPDLGVTISHKENPGYTMRSIAALEKRIENLEYYTSLSMLEKEAQDERFLDSSGLDRFKNGLLTDTFRGFSVASVADPDFHCSIDRSDRVLRSYFNDDTVQFVPNFVNNAYEGGVAQNGKTYGAAWQETVYTEQLQCSKIESIVTELLYDIPPPPPPPAGAPVVVPTVPGVPDEPVVIIVPRPVEVGDPIPEIPPPPPQPPTPVPEPVPVPPTPEPPVPTAIYKLNRSDYQVEVDNALSIEIETQNVAIGTTIAWTITGVTLKTGSASGTATVPAGGHCPKINFEFSSTGTATFQLAATDSAGGTAGTSTTITVVAAPPVSTGGSSVNINKCAAGYRWDQARQQCVSVPVVVVQAPICYGNINIYPAGDPWFDTSYIEPTTNNKTGDADNFTYSDAAWNIEWGSWEATSAVTETSSRTWEDSTGFREEFIGVEYGGDASWGENGYDYYSGANIYQSYESFTTYEQLTQNTITTGALSGTSIYNGPLTEETTSENTISSQVISSNRETAITCDITGLCPNTEHNLYGNGVLYKTFVSDGSGAWSGSAVVGQGEFTSSPVSVNASATGNGAVSGTVSTASGSWSFGQGIQTVLQTVTDRTTYPMPPTKKVTGIPSTRASTNPLDATIIKTYEVPGDVTYDWFDTYAPYVVSAIAVTPNTSITTDLNTSVTVSSTIYVDPGYNVYGPLSSYDFSYGGTEGVATYELYVPAAATNVTAGGTVTEATVVANDSTIVNDFDLFSDADAAALAEYMAMFNNCFFGGWDPMAQTFVIQGVGGSGIYVNSADLFFHTIGKEGNNNGITLELRTVENGYPASEVLGRVYKTRNNCSQSVDDGDGTFTPVATKFTFPQPVYLESGKEYCIVPIPDADDPDYTVWIAELGKNRHGSTNVISKQAHGGILFTSANNRTWSARQKEDMMFRINRCEFTTNVDYKIPLVNTNTDWIEFSSLSAGTRFDVGSTINGFTLAVSAGGTGYTSTAPTVSITDSTGFGTPASGTTTIANIGGVDLVTGVTLTVPGSGWTKASIPVVTLTGGNGTGATITATLNLGRVQYYQTKYDTHTITVLKGHFTSGDKVGDAVRTATVATLHNRVINSYVLNAATANHNNLGTITPKFALTDTGAGAANSTYEDCFVDKTIELLKEKTLYSYSNEYATYSGNKTAKLEFTINTRSKFLSPFISLEKTIFAMFTNDINNDASTEEVRRGGGATTKYISKAVSLADGQDAEDLKVYLDNKIPTEGDVKVYCKVKADADDASFTEDLYWREMSLESQPANTASTAWGEFLYKLPVKASGFGLNSGTGILEYDVTGISSIAVTTAGSGYSVAPSVLITHSGGGYGAEAEAILSGVPGSVASINIISAGRDYSGGTITVTLSGGGGTGAVAGAATTTTITYTTFKKYAIKIVHLSSNTSQIPKSTNLRAYALQV